MKDEQSWAVSSVHALFFFSTAQCMKIIFRIFFLQTSKQAPRTRNFVPQQLVKYCVLRHTHTNLFKTFFILSFLVESELESESEPPISGSGYADTTMTTRTLSQILK